jgi:hypothetical protein
MMESWLFGVVLALVALQLAMVFIRPGSDIPRIKRDFEANGARVSRISSAGFELGLIRRGHYYRKYRIVVDHPFTGRSTYLVGVAASWFSDKLKRYD